MLQSQQVPPECPVCGQPIYSSSQWNPYVNMCFICVEEYNDDPFHYEDEAEYEED